MIVPVIIGPTAGGKTAFSLHLAQRLLETYNLRCEVINADAVQLFKYLDIGSAKPSREELQNYPHHLVGVINPRSRMSSATWYGMATESIRNVQKAGRLPLVVGGSEHYVATLWDPRRRDHLHVPQNQTLREAWRNKASIEIYSEIANHPKLTENVDLVKIGKRDRPKLLRTLEILESTCEQEVEPNVSVMHNNSEPPLQFACIGLMHDVSPGSTLNRRINLRVNQMIQQGLEAEVRQLWQRKLLGSSAVKAIGYRHFVDCFERHLRANGTIRQTRRLKTIDRIKTDSRNLAKRQQRWVDEMMKKVNWYETKVNIQVDMISSDWWCTTPEMNREVWDSQADFVIEKLFQGQV